MVPSEPASGRDGQGPPPAPVTAFTTVATEADAKALARRLLDERLVACCNLLPMQSLYRWEGEVQEEPEVGMFLKTDETRVARLMQRLPELHPYDVPCLEVLSVQETLPAFARWVQAETTL